MFQLLLLKRKTCQERAISFRFLWCRYLPSRHRTSCWRRTELLATVLWFFSLLFLFGRRWETVCVKCNPITENENLFPVVDRKIRESYILLRQKMTDDVHPLPNLGDHLWFNYSPLFFCFCHLSHSPLVLFPSLIAYQLFPRLLVLFFPSLLRSLLSGFFPPCFCLRLKPRQLTLSSSSSCYKQKEGDENMGFNNLMFHIIGWLNRICCDESGMPSDWIAFDPHKLCSTSIYLCGESVMKCTWRDACSFLSFFFACASL